MELRREVIRIIARLLWDHFCCPKCREIITLPKDSPVYKEAIRFIREDEEVRK